MSLECDCAAILCEICGQDINLKESTRADIGGGNRLVHKECLENEVENNE